MRISRIQRETKETEINCTLELDGRGTCEVDTGCGFLDHMLELFTKHGRFDLQLTCRGDVHVDFHHTTEDVGIVLGRAFSEALDDRIGISRYGSMLLPMDEALVLSAVDISGRAMLCYNMDFQADKIGEFDTELIEEFFLAFVRELRATVHIRQIDGKNAHHVAEAAFKGFGRAMAAAVEIDIEAPDEIHSTKGTML